MLRIAVEKIEHDKPLPELGLDSLMAVELLNRIQEALGVSLPAGHFASGPTIAKLAATLAGMMAGEDKTATRAVPAAPAPEALPPWTIRDEVRWDETITRNASAPDPAASASPSALFLTGASTLAGSHVLRRLLDETAADIYCLEDAGGAAGALAGIRAGLDACSLLDGADQSRIIPVAGQLAKPRFGLSESQFETLSQTVDGVYHLGALVRHLSPYSIHKAPNVGGALEALRLTALGRPKPLHFYSSISVFSGIADGRTIMETDEPGDRAHILGGYAESRWVAEKLMWQAQARGFPVSIYRPGLIIGDGGESAAAGDLVWRLVRHCIHLGLAPGSDLDLYLTPVDFVAAAMVRLSAGPARRGAVSI